MVTGMDDLASINQAYESGANDFVSKPINWPILGYRARYVLRSAQAARTLRELEEKQAAIVRAMPDMIFLMARDGSPSGLQGGLRHDALRAAGGLSRAHVAEVLPTDVGQTLLYGIERALEKGDVQSIIYKLPMRRRRTPLRGAHRAQRTEQGGSRSTRHHARRSTTRRRSVAWPTSTR